ncbi:MAG: hypothetical protein EOS21_03140 [Mesorhizobium sp.]|nr:MAG: hypothetical protein EOS21_03140 [Mesorhizobium sp.]
MENVLSDFGERRLLSEIIPKYVSSAGDDCAVVESGGRYLTLSTDPVPTPAAKAIGGDDDPYWLGWLLVTINASDIAASGARPSSFVAALDLPGTLRISEFERLLSGIRDSCRENGLSYVGGNLREAAAIAAVGTAIGFSDKPPLTRIGATSQDIVVVIGEGGRFWADAERIRLGEALDKSRTPLFSPISQSNIMHRLHERDLLVCAMDTSDGLAPSLVELCKVNHLGIDVQLQAMRNSTSLPGVRSERLWMGWGDWTIVAGVSPSKYPILVDVLRELGGRCTAIGTFEAEFDGVILRSGNAAVPLGRLESERFAADSWFVQGIDEYRRRMLALKLPD